MNVPDPGEPWSCDHGGGLKYPSCGKTYWSYRDREWINACEEHEHLGIMTREWERNKPHQGRYTRDPETGKWEPMKWK